MHYIEFPNLGIHFELNPVLFSIGNISIHWYGIITALAFLVVLGGVLKNAPKFDLNQDDLIDMILITVPIGIIGARIFYVVVNWQYYSANLSEIYKIWNGGLAIYGGIIFGIITILLFCRFRKINALHLLDHIVVYLVLGQVVGRWGNFVNQELFGPNTSLPWGMTGDIIQNTIIREGYTGVDPSLPVHPLFIYEALWNLIAFFTLIWFRKRKKLNGEVFSLYMISYGGARFVIDSLRFDLKIGDLNVNRLIGLCCIIVFLAIFIYRRVRMKKQVLEELPYEPSQYRDIINEISEEPDDKIGFDIEAVSDSDTEEDATANFDADTDADTDVEVEAEAETEAETKSEAETKTETDTDAQTKA